jgi:hypothetical protein
MRSSGLRRCSGRLTALGGALGCLLALALLLDVAQAGRTFLFCVAMQRVVPKSCCAHAGAEPSSDAAMIAATSPDCCELRVAATLTPYSPAARTSLPVESPLALAVMPLPLPAARTPALSTASPASTRAGPPPSRARARLMVFLI